jgi:hypothetical protein
VKFLPATGVKDQGLATISGSDGFEQSSVMPAEGFGNARTVLTNATGTPAVWVDKAGLNADLQITKAQFDTFVQQVKNTYWEPQQLQSTLSVRSLANRSTPANDDPTFLAPAGPIVITAVTSTLQVDAPRMIQNVDLAVLASLAKTLPVTFMVSTLTSHEQQLFYQETQFPELAALGMSNSGQVVRGSNSNDIRIDANGIFENPVFDQVSQFSTRMALNNVSNQKLPARTTYDLYARVMIYAQPVPEPSTYALMGLGLVGLSVVARQRRAKQAH